MNIKITYNWLLEFLDTNASPFDIQQCLSLCGPSIERVNKIGDDYVFDVEVTSNRIDTASVYGIARDAVAILPRFGFRASLKKQKQPVVSKPTSKLDLTISDPGKLCKRIIGVVMANVKVGPSPDFLKDRLEKSGMRSLYNLIDITNYLMLELGQPLHVFDYDRICTAKLIFRKANKGEFLITLDGKKCELVESDVVVDDGTGRIIDLPGIMGTENSVVHKDTKRIVVFTESSNPTNVRKTSMRLNLRTLAATINEKNPDPEQSMSTIQKAVEFYKKYASADESGSIVDIYPIKQKIHKIQLRINFLNERLGIKLLKDEIIQILTSLGFKLMKSHSPQFLNVLVPTFRYPDVSIPEDIVEEVARIYGYHNFPNNLPSIPYVKQPKEMEDLFIFQNRIKVFLKHTGLNEVLNYSMISKELIEELGLKLKDHLSLSNALSEEIRYLRRSLTPSLIKNMKENKGRRDSLRLFELAKVYLPRENDLPEEQYKLGIAVTGTYFDMKGIVEMLLDELNISNYEVKKSAVPFLSGKLQSEITVEGKKLGYMGEMKNNSIAIAELDFALLVSHSKVIPSYVKINPYSIIKLDLTVRQTESLSFQEIKNTAFTSSQLLTKTEFISAYQNNVSIRFYFNSPLRNITENEAKLELSKIVKNLMEKS